MISSLILCAYVLQRKICERADEVHGHLTRHRGILGAVLPAQILLLERIVTRRFTDYYLRRGDIGAYAYNVLYGALYGVYGDNVVLIFPCSARASATFQQ